MGSSVSPACWEQVKTFHQGHLDPFTSSSLRPWAREARHMGAAVCHHVRMLSRWEAKVIPRSCFHCCGFKHNQGQIRLATFKGFHSGSFSNTLSSDCYTLASVKGPLSADRLNPPQRKRREKTQESSPVWAGEEFLLFSKMMS